MTDMPLPSRLTTRGKMYHIRVAVPRDIQKSYGQAEVTFSLRTRDKQEALKRLRKASAEVDERFEQHRLQLARKQEPMLADLTAEQIKHLEDVYYAHLLDEDDDVRLDGMDEQEFAYYGELSQNIEAVDRQGIARGVPPIYARSEAEEVLTWNNVDLRLAPASKSWPRLIRAILSASVRASTAKRQRNEGTPVATPAMPVVERQQTGPLASQIVETWVAEKTRKEGSWTEKTADANRLWTERFIEIAGDKPIGDYRKSHAREFKSALLALPANWTKTKELEKLSMKAAAAKAAELSLEPMAARNVNKILGFVRAFWNWSKANYDDVTTNPFDGLNVKISGKANDERHPFSTDELAAIFRSPIYTGCKSHRYHNTPGDLLTSDQGIYWVPLIGLFSGCRSGEIIQLRTEDVKIEGDIAYLSVTDDGQDLELKTAGSRRRIPVHPTLKELGFLKFVERQRKQKQKRLFPDMPKAADNTYSTAYSRKFSNTLKSLGIKHEKNAFHSFRHSFEDACRNSRIPLDFINALQGHSQSGMAGRYGHGLYGLQLLNEEMEKLRYDGLDLSALSHGMPNRRAVA